MDIKGILEKMRAEGQIGPNAEKGKQLALRGTGKPAKPQSESDSESESEAEEEELPPGPIDANRCDAKGPGFAGAAAGAPVKLVITAKDSSGKRIREGGAYIQVYIEPVSRNQEQQPRIDAEITDHTDGTYTAIYTAPSKGNYKLHLVINGQPMNDSPFPVFFSAPEQLPAIPVSAPAAAPAQDAMAPADPNSSLPVSAPQLVMSGAMLPSFSAAFPNLGGPAMNLSLGQQAAQVGVRFPTEDPNKLSSMLLVGGVSPFATTDQLRSVFGFCGTIISIELSGPANSYAFVEYGSPGEATAALAMNGVQLLGQHMNVENARAAKADAETQPPPAASMPIPAATSYAMLANPYLSAQMQQLQQFQMLSQQQAALAEQVANMRAMQRSSGQALAGSGDAQKNAALAAALALSKRLAAAAGGNANGGAEGTQEEKGDRKERKRSSRSRSRSRDRSKRARSRSRGRRDRSRERRRSSPDRRRARSSDKKTDRHKDRRDRDRRDDRDRHRDRKSRDERSSRHEREERRGDKSSRREKSRDREGRRDRSRERRSKRDRSREKEERRKHRESKQESGQKEEGEGQQQVFEAAAAPDPAAQIESAAGDDLEQLLNELGE